jgi:hypothetical protein
MRTLASVLSVIVVWAAPAAAEDWKALVEQLASPDKQIEAQAGDRLQKVVFPWLQSLDTASLNAQVAQIAPLCDDPRPGVSFKAVALITMLVMMRRDSAAVIKPAVPALLRHFSDSNPKLRDNAILCIAAALPAPPTEALQPLIGLLKDSNLRAVGGASLGLMRLSPTAPAAEDAVVGFLSKEKQPDRLIAVLNGIGQAHTAGTATVGAVAGYLRHRDERVASAAIDALQELGGKAASALPALEAVAADPDAALGRKAAAKTAIEVISRQK